MLIDVPKSVNIVRLRCVRLGPQRLSIAIGQGRLCPRSHYSLFTAQGCTRRARRSRPTISDHYSLITRFSVRRSRPRIRSRARPWCSPGRATRRGSSRRSPGWCRANRSTRRWSRTRCGRWPCLKVDFNVIDAEYPSPQTGISKSRFVKANTGQINPMKKRRPFGIGARRPVAMREDPSIWDRR